MSARIRAGPGAGNPAQVQRPFPWIRWFAALALSMVASGCAGPPATPFASADPADPAAPAKPASYRSTIEPYVRQRPVEPKPWREQNERVAPAPKE
jgi:hypothetical protein